MAGERETVMAALFALGSAVTWTDPVTNHPLSFAYTARRLKSFRDVPAQPALLQAEGDEFFSQVTGQPGKQRLTCNWVVYHKTGFDKSAVPAQMNNQIVDALVAALVPTGRDALTGKQTLGGLVHHTWVDGKAFKDAGDLDGQGLIVLPISVLLPT